MALVGIQIVAILFALAMLYFAFVFYKRREFSLQDYAVWGIAWLAFMLITIFPRSMDAIVQTLKLEDTRLFLMIAGMAFLSAIVFYLYFVVRRNQRKIEGIVMDIARKEKFERKRR